MIDAAKGRREARSPVPISRPRGELASILEASFPRTRLNEMILGKPLAGELGLPLFSVRLDGLITKFMGETAAKLRQVFDATSLTRGVYFFDEFDAIGSLRGLANEVGEIRRVLNSFLLLIKQDRSHSLVVAATNHPKILDPALFRRFDNVLRYDPPDRKQIEDLLQTRLAGSAVKCVRWAVLAEAADGLSHNEVTRAADEVLKGVLIDQRAKVCEADIRAMLEERQAVADRLAIGTRAQGIPAAK